MSTLGWPRPAIHPRLYERLSPILAQRKKDQARTFLHSTEFEVPRLVSMQSLICEAIEIYCDLFVPIETTPPERLTPRGKSALQYLPTNPQAPPIHRDEWIIKFAEGIKRVLEEETAASAEASSIKAEDGKYGKEIKK